MRKEHKPFSIVKIKEFWCVFFKKKKVSSYFDKKSEAEDYKSFLRSR